MGGWIVRDGIPPWGIRLREQAKFVYRHRFLLVTRREHLSEAEEDTLSKMLRYAPGLHVLRAFVDELHGLFVEGQTDACSQYHAERERSRWVCRPFKIPSP